MNSGDNVYLWERALGNNRMRESVFSMPVVVGEASIDLLGHVNNREYMRWMETAATAHAASLGWSFDALRDAGRVWVVRQHWIEYLRPAHLEDKLVVATWVENVRRLSSLRRYAVLREGELLTVGATEWVLVDYEKRTPAPISEEMRASFQLVPPDAEVLREMGIRRMVRFAPTPGLVAASK